jgi:CubicO group peptidase (beta-lactamase class C family)
MTADTGAHRTPIGQAHWQERLRALSARHLVPGAALGILRVGPGGSDDQVEASYGVLSKATGVEATTDSLFQIGSITKVFTTTLVMQLVEQGRLDLDAPVRDVLSELALADRAVAEKVTVRHLLTHTSGIDGDLFTDTGRGDDCLERFVAGLGEAAQTHPLGATWSYCNTGFVIAGRVIEKLTGQVWDTALRQRLLEPLGLEHTVTLPEEALLFRTAVGHVSEGGGESQPAKVWTLSRSSGPAGLVTASVGDVLAFARMHLAGGRAKVGTRVLGEAAAAEMQQPQAALPHHARGAHSWGLGWMRLDWDGHLVLGHDGSTIGQAAFLRLLPDRGLAVALLTNGGHSDDLYEDLFREIFDELAGVALPPRFEPPETAPGVRVDQHLGTYERAGTRLEVFIEHGRAMLRTTITGPLAGVEPDPPDLELHPVGPDLFAVREPSAQTWTPVFFYSLPTGDRYLFMTRATPRVVEQRFELRPHLR